MLGQIFDKNTRVGFTAVKLRGGLLIRCKRLKILKITGILGRFKDVLISDTLLVDLPNICDLRPCASETRSDYFIFKCD